MKQHANVAIFVPHAGCTHACSFCNQRSISGALKVPSPQDVTTILQKAECSLGENTQAQIAFFGGSFTAIEREQMCALLEAAQLFIKNGSFASIRISTRPDCIDAQILELLARYHVTDIELGVQSMDNGVLAANRRGHTAEEVVAACQAIREQGFGLGVQMMTGLYTDTPQKSLCTARALATLKPDTVRIYPALTLRGTELEKRWETGEYSPPALENTIQLCARLLAFFTRRGIRVIRLGLHDSESLKGQIVAGAYHPAMRERCESRVLLTRVWRLLREVPAGKVILYVHPHSISKMSGQRRENILELEKRGFSPIVRGDASVGYLQVRVERLNPA